MSTMAPVSVCVDESLLEMSAVSGKVFGPFHMRFGDESFPEQGWTDFAGTALSSWADELTKLIADPTYIAECHFMDGPFWLEVEQVGRGCARIAGYQRPSEDSSQQLGEWTVSVDHLVAEVRNALRNVSTKCRQMGWATDDTKSIDDALRYLDSRTAH